MLDRAKKFVFYQMLLLLLSICLITTGCNQASGDQPDADKPLWTSSVDGGCEPAPPIWVALSAPKSRVEYGEDFELTVQFRGFESPSNGPSEHGKIECEIYMKSGTTGGEVIDKEILIKKYENFSTDCYLNNEQDGGKYVGAEETVTLPADWFTNQEGAIVVCVRQRITFENEAFSPEECTVGACVYYVKNQKNIQLYGSYFDYYNRKQ